MNAYTLDRFGLRGDAQRLGAEWRTTGLITDKEQAYAAAGMSLLAGHSSPIFRQLNRHETLLAEVEAYQLLGDAWKLNKPDGPLPDSNSELSNQSPEFGLARSKAGQAGFNDPRNEAGSLDSRVPAGIEIAENHVDGGEKAINATYQKAQKTVQGASDGGFADMHSDKSAYFRDQISKAANSQPSAAEFEYDAIGGAIYNTAQNMSLIGYAGTDSVKYFINEFDNSRKQGKTLGESLLSALAAAPEGGLKAAESWADQRVAESGNRLTPTQRDYYRASMFESFAGASVVGDHNTFLGKSSELSDKLRSEHGDHLGSEIASLLRRAAGQNRPDLINLLGSYNLANN